MRYFSLSLFNQYQNLYIAPAIDDKWEKMKSDLWKERENKEVILSSDGSNDSPGHCAQLYIPLLTWKQKLFLKMNIVDVREVEGRKSTNMERIWFERGLDNVLTSNMVIKEVVTDGHLVIGALMSKLKY